MSKVAILIPTYGRVDRLQAVAYDALDATPSAHVYLIMEPDEVAEAPPVIGATILTDIDGFGTYAKAIDYGYRNTTEPYLFAGADDLHFEPGWLEHALDHMRGETMVVGTNDLHNPEVLAGQHATHYLVDRRYLDLVGGDALDGNDTFLASCYQHNWVDREFVETAKLRGVFSPCLASVVEHQHVSWGQAGMDATYAKSFADEPADRDLYDYRMRLIREVIACE